jgi:hypothetical protein
MTVASGCRRKGKTLKRGGELAGTSSSLKKSLSGKKERTVSRSKLFTGPSYVPAWRRVIPTVVAI